MKKAEEANAYYNKQPGKMNTYEASEGVKDMPIKQTEESHKKCSPGEFGMHKEGARAFGQKTAGGLFAPKTPNNYNPALHKMLQQWEKTAPPVYGDTKTITKETGDANFPKEHKLVSTGLGPVTQEKLSPELIAALQQHMRLQKNDTPDELDAAHTLLELNDLAPKKAGAFTFGKRAADMFANERAMVEKAPLLPTGTPMPGHVWDLNDGNVRLRPNEVRDWEAIPQLPERSELTDELAWQKKHRNEENRSRAMFQAIAPPVLETAGGLVGSKPGAMAGKMLGQGLSVASPVLDEYANREEALRAMKADTDKATRQMQMQPTKIKPPMNPEAFQRRPFDEPGAPLVPKTLPAGQPRPPVVQPPRGLGSSLRKAGALAFGQKLANDWMGLSSSRNGPGGLISEKTLPKADATAKNWGAAQPPVPPPSLATRVAVPSSQQQYNDMAQAHPGLKQISPNMQQNMLNRISQGGEYNSQAQAPSLQDAGRAIGDHLKMFGEGAQNIGTQMRNSPGIKQVLDAVPRGGPTPAPTQPQQRVNPYDDPNYDHYNKPGLDPIKHMLNFARPVRKALQPAL